MPDGIFATACYCTVCGAEIKEGADFDSHGYAGHGLPKPSREERIAQIKADKAAGIYPPSCNRRATQQIQQNRGRP